MFGLDRLGLFARLSLLILVSPLSPISQILSFFIVLPRIALLTVSPFIALFFYTPSISFPVPF